MLTFYFRFQYLEDMGCVTTMVTVKRKPITLFSTYDHIKTGSLSFSFLETQFTEKKNTNNFFFLALPTQLDSLEDIFIEVTIDAVTRMSTFIGDRKYKEDFI